MSPATSDSDSSSSVPSADGIDGGGESTCASLSPPPPISSAVRRPSQRLVEKLRRDAEARSSSDDAAAEAVVLKSIEAACAAGEKSEGVVVETVPTTEPEIHKPSSSSDAKKQDCKQQVLTEDDAINDTEEDTNIKKGITQACSKVVDIVAQTPIVPSKDAADGARNLDKARPETISNEAQEGPVPVSPNRLPLSAADNSQDVPVAGAERVAGPSAGWRRDVRFNPQVQIGAVSVPGMSSGSGESGRLPDHASEGRNEAPSEILVTAELVDEERGRRSDPPRDMLVIPTVVAEHVVAEEPAVDVEKGMCARAARPTLVAVSLLLLTAVAIAVTVAVISAKKGVSDDPADIEPAGNERTVACDKSDCWVQIGSDLVGPTDFDEFGEEVSLSGNGGRLAVSARLYGSEEQLRLCDDDPRSGAVWIYDSETVDKSKGRDLSDFSEVHVFYGAPGDEIRGYLSTDGSTVGIGARYRSRPNVSGIGSGNDCVKGVSGGYVEDVGSARFYKRVKLTGDWMPLGEEMEGTDAHSMLGKAITLSDDGGTAAVTQPSKDKAGGNGTVQAFRYQDGLGWVQLGSDLTGEHAKDQFGWSASLSADGSTLAVGARHNSVRGPKTGHVQVFRLTADRNWKQLGKDIDGEAEGDKFGGTCHLSADGLTIAVGAWFHNGVNGEDSGRIRVFAYNKTERDWAPIGNAIDGDDRDDRLGQVSLSADGRRLATGSVGETKGDKGYARVYHNVGNQWHQLGGTLTGDRTGDNFGMAVSLAADGTHLAVGSPSRTSDEFRAGYVRLYYLRPR